MTNTELLNALAVAVNDGTFKKRSKAIMLSILTNQQNYIIDKIECLRKVDSTLTLAVGNGEINLPAGFASFPSTEMEIKRGFVGIGTNGRIPLTVTSTAILNNDDEGWRNQGNGVPEFYYIIRQGTPKIGFYPKASTNFISTYGSGIYIDMIYHPAAIIEDSNLPFDNSSLLIGVVHTLLLFRSIWQIKLEDKEYPDADRMKKEVTEMLEEAQEFVDKISATPGHHGFEENFS